MEQADIKQEPARQYNRGRLCYSIAEAILGFAILYYFLASGASVWLAGKARAVSSSFLINVGWYFIVFMLAAWLMNLFFNYFSDFRLEHAYQLSNQSLADWFSDQVKGLGIELLLGLFLVELIYYLLRNAPHNWWLVAGVVFGLLFIMLANLAPVLLMPLFFKFTPLADEKLKDSLLKLAAKSSTRVQGVYVMDLSKKSKKANAGLVGLGNTRRIVVADNLLVNYDYDEIEVVLAHELGHHVYHHLAQGIARQTLITFMCMFAVDYVLKKGVAGFGLSGIADIAGFPLLLLAVMIVTLLALPVNNFISRRMEYHADNYALKLTGKHDAFTSLMNKIRRQNLAELTPHYLVEAIFHSHPSISKRLENCRVQRDKADS
jgi:STE24 endopeptidase